MPDDRVLAVERILSCIPADQHDRLVPLLRDGPALAERLIGTRPHRACLWRWRAHGTHGVKLDTVAAGRTLLVSARMLAAHLVAVGAARRDRDTARRAAAVKATRAPRVKGRAVKARGTDRARRTRDTLARHGLAQEAAP